MLEFGYFHNKQIISDNNMLCPRCEMFKPLDDFRVYKVTGRHCGLCKGCRHDREVFRCNSSIDSFLNNVCVIKRSECKKSGRDFDLTKEFLVGLWYSQNGLCYYTDQPMTWGYGNQLLPSAVSIDQVVPNGGYTQNNIVLCQDIVNKIKRDYTYSDLENLNPAEWSKRIKKFIS